FCVTTILNSNSRLISALIDTRKHTDDITKKEQQLWLLYSLWVHYLYIQYGFTNDIQIQLELKDSLNWLVTLVNNNPENIEVKDFANSVLDDLSNRINQLKNKFK
ncbi:unnamed protein product, partial [marine sediment metagenome]